MCIRDRGGEGGNGINGASGGNGASEIVNDLVYGSVPGGSLTLEQDAMGGSGGDGDASPGAGGTANSTLTLSSTADEAILTPVSYTHLNPYLPANAGLLYATAMMAAGWDGAPKRNAPGFPDNGQWTVRWEKLRPLP